MRKENFFLIIASGLFAGVLLVFYMNNIRTRTDDVQQNQPFIPVVDPDFKPRHNDDLPFEAEISVDHKENANDLDGMIQHDAKGTVRFEAKQNGELIELYITPTETIVCSNNSTNCFSGDDDINDRLFNPDALIYTKNDLRGLGEGLVNRGDVTCGELMCELWKSSSVVPTPITSILLEKDSGNIIAIEGIEDGSVISIDFEYKEVDVILPLNVTPAITE